MRRLIVLMLIISLFTGAVVAQDNSTQTPPDNVIKTYNITINETTGNLDVDGEERGAITVVRTGTYKINVENNSGEYVHISTDESLDDGSGVYYQGVTVTGDKIDNIPATDDGTIYWEVSPSTPNELYYESYNSTGLGANINVLAAPSQPADTTPLPVLFGVVEGVPYWTISAVVFALLLVQYVWLADEDDPF
jgi:hypothetical protein